jgi:hypothetical protein
MMRRRGFYLLPPAGVVLIAAAVIAFIVGGRGPAPVPPPGPVFPGLADRLNELAWIRIARGAAKVDFANVAGQWVMVDKHNYPAAPARLDRLLRGLADLTLIEPAAPDIGRSAPADHDSAPGGTPTLIVLRARTGDTVAQAAVVAVPADPAIQAADTVHVRAPGAERASVARGSLALPVDPLDWLDRGIIDVPSARIASLRLTGADGATLALRRDNPDAAFAVADLLAEARLKSGAALSDLAGTLAGLAFDDVKPLALVELPEGGVSRAEFTTFDGLAIALRVFAHEGADWVAVATSGAGAAEAESDAINARLARWVYAIPAARARLLRTRPDDLTGPAKGL